MVANIVTWQLMSDQSDAQDLGQLNHMTNIQIICFETTATGPRTYMRIHYWGQILFLFIKLIKINWYLHSQ